MKLASLEMMMCSTAYELLTWLNKNKNTSIPSKKDFDFLQSSPEIQTVGVWFDKVGLLAILKMRVHSQALSYGLTATSFPMTAKDVVGINAGFASDLADNSAPRITLWLEPDLSGAALTEIESALISMGFVKEYANNWDKVN